MVRALCLLVFCGSLLVCGCSSYDVKALPYDSSLTSVVLVENPKVIVRDFVDVLQDEFNARSIKVIRKPGNYVAKSDEYVVRYNALQSWDISLYLSYATIRVEKDNMTKAKGIYKAGSFDLAKWRGTQWKMSNLYGELLKNYQEECK
jgi:hypothetical protein